MKKPLLLAIITAVSLIADQATKVWARANLRGGPERTVIDGFWSHRYSENAGSAFGIFRDFSHGRLLLTVFGLIALCVLVYLARRPEYATRVGQVALGLIAGGAVGNLYDRILYGKVTDFVVWYVTMGGQRKEWPTFNVADATLVAGVLLLILFGPRASKKAEEVAAKEKAGNE